MAKKNCWEVKNCGRQPGGAKANELGICPAAQEKRLNGIHNGTYGGRCCWAICGTLCGGKVQGLFATKIRTCMECEFYKQVCLEEGANLVKVTAILEKLK